jgi:hypothetical protein
MPTPGNSEEGNGMYRATLITRLVAYVGSIRMGGEGVLREAYTREQLEGNGMYRATLIIRLVAYVGCTRMGGGREAEGCLHQGAARGQRDV